MTTNPTLASRDAATAARTLRLAAPALAGYVVVRLVGLIVLWAMARHFDEQTWDLLAKWDGRWFIDIAEHGYDPRLVYGPDGTVAESNHVFFPAYAFLIKAIAGATGLGSIYAGIVASFLAGIAAAWGIFAVGHELYGRAVATLLTILWGIQTHAIVESMVYSEGLFTALAAWCLYAVLRQRWITAGVLSALAGATRASAVILVIIVAVAGIRELRRRQNWRPLACAVLSPVGLVGYLAWVAHVLNRADGWFYAQDKGWGSTFDGGRDTFTMLFHIIQTWTGLELYEVTGVLLASIVLFVWLVLLRPPWPLLAYAGGLLVLTIGAAGYYHAKARFLLPAFPLLIPVAIGLARISSRRLAVLLPSLALASAVYGGYLLLMWPISF